MIDDRTETATTSPWRQRVPGPQLPGVVSGVTLLAGLWLVLAPSAWDHGGTPDAAAARWNDVVVGACLAVLGYLRLRRPVRLTPMTSLGLALSAWLAIAPFALAYDHVLRPTLQDVVAGALVGGLTLAGHLVATGDPAPRPGGGQP